MVKETSFGLFILLYAQSWSCTRIPCSEYFIRILFKGKRIYAVFLAINTDFAHREEIGAMTSPIWTRCSGESLSVFRCSPQSSTSRTFITTGRSVPRSPFIYPSSRVHPCVLYHVSY
ncbi:hypothetical protein BJ165DRAFT_1518102 [Panaeolus papilionaceus]|nr:hypothetical protein BJ165DRAFT_1518102 [Panaeolus papilionaceus]